MTKAAPTARQWREEGQLLPLPTGGHLFYHDAGDGEVVLMLHGFPTWSWDWAAVAARLTGYRVIAPDFPGFGFSDKPRRRYAIAEQADAISLLAMHLGVRSLSLVAHDYGTIVAQELLDRSLQNRLSFAINRIAFLNGGVVYNLYRPTRMQKLLVKPIIGAILSRWVNQQRLRAGISAVLGPGRKLSDAEFDGLWVGIAHQNGHTLSSRLLRYNIERKQEYRRWEAALSSHPAPLQFIWGLADPVSGRHVLDAARLAYPRAQVAAREGLGHYPQIEAPEFVTEELKRFLG